MNFLSSGPAVFLFGGQTETRPTSPLTGTVGGQQAGGEQEKEEDEKEEDEGGRRELHTETSRAEPQKKTPLTLEER